MNIDWDEQRILRAKEYAAEEHKRLQLLLSKQRPSGPTANPLNRTSILTNLAIYSRIYVGSVRFDVTDEDVHLLFGQFGAIRSMVMLKDPNAVKHRGYGFIEYWAPEAAKLAQSLDDCEVAGRTIKVGRPNNFPSDLPPGIPRPLPARLYIANLPADLTQDELKTLFAPFGTLSLVQLIDPPVNADVVLPKNRHSLSAYVEYEKVTDAQHTMDALQNFVLCGQRMRISPTIIGGEVSSCGPDLMGPQETQIQVQLNQSIIMAQSDNTSPLQQKSPPVVSCILALRNVISFEELVSLDEPDKNELQDEIMQECSKCGTVVRIILHGSETSLQASAYVQFSTPQEVDKTITVFNNRWFDGRLLIAESFDEDKFVMRSFD